MGQATRVCRAADAALPSTPAESHAGGHAYHAPPPEPPKIAAASDEAQKQIATFKIPAGFQLSVWAAEPMLANPVCLTIDEHGKAYVGETYRINRGVEDDRGHMDWLDDDMSGHTVEDRLALYKKHLGDRIVNYSKYDDRIRLIEDRSGSGKADFATTFADRFNDPLQGIGAGLLARHGDLYYTCIPDLWLLRDTKNAGVADVRKSLAYGFGSRVSFLGHDLHGLIFGPDGNLYFSQGDRGFSVKSDGKTLARPDTGAVFRCNPDGSGLEIFCDGVRNPQKLAFDEFGNLFTCDNNSDSGDRARWVYLVEGGDTGWRMPYQYLADRGPFNREKIWYPQFDGQAAYIVPPVAWLADGPSGLVYYPGVGFDDKWQGHFFLVDFRGGPAESGVHSLAVKPKGASFEMVDHQQFVWHMLATDVAWGPDSSLYVTDWVEGWDGCGKGRIYRVSDPAKQKDPIIAETKRLIGEGMSGRSVDELIVLLGHKDMRVRQEAQFELAERIGKSHSAADIAKLAGIAAHGDDAKRLARLHAIWALGQIGRVAPQQALEPLVALAADQDAEVRAQVARVLGDDRFTAASDKLLPLLKDENLHVRSLAAIALGKLGAPAAVEPAFAMLRENNDKDAVLRHAGVMTLVGCADERALIAAADDSSAAVRVGALLALRRLQSPAIAKFLQDTDPRLVLEAARAIHDLPDSPISAAMPQLAALIHERIVADATVKDKISKDYDGRDAMLRRILNANFRIGQPANATAVAEFAARQDVPEGARIEALEMLADWAKPSGHDRVTNFWRPLPPRDEAIAAQAIRPTLGGVFSGSDKVRQAAAKTTGRLGIKEVAPLLAEMGADKSRPIAARVDAIRALEQLRDKRLDDLIAGGLKDSEPEIRNEVRAALATVRPDEAVPLLEQVAADENAQLTERQGALATLGRMKSAKAEAIVSAWLDKLLAGQAPRELQLDVLQSAEARKSASLAGKLRSYNDARPKKESIDPYRETLYGGDAARGHAVFFELLDAECVRCHTVAGVGGKVGPDLTKIAAEKPREYLLESVVDPNKVIAKGFEMVILTLDDGRNVAGIIKAEDDKTVMLMTPEGKQLTIDKKSIEDRARGKSPMPQDISSHLSKAQLRDLVEYLSTLK